MESVSSVHVLQLFEEMQEAAIRYIAENYADSTLSVESVAAATGYTSQHLRRLFHEAYHMLPRDDIRRIRVEHATALLEIGMPIGEIAERCGFTNAGYFSHVFREATGMLPSTYIISKLYRKSDFPSIKGTNT